VLEGTSFCRDCFAPFGSFVAGAARDFIMYRCACLGAFLALLALLSIADAARAENGLASYYGGRGHRGEMTCAHRTRPLGSIVTVTHASHSIQCRVNDRGPFVRGRVIDVSISAARALGMMGAGVVRVSLQ
jgi:peptidoglycan lytic transglycosylase